MSFSSTLGLDINQSASNMLLSQPATPNNLWKWNLSLPIWILFKSNSLPASSPSFSFAPGPAFQTATMINSENLRQHFQAPSIQPPPGIPSPFPVVPPIDTSVPPPPGIFSQPPSDHVPNTLPTCPEAAPNTSISQQPNTCTSCQVQIPSKTPNIPPTDSNTASKQQLCFYSCSSRLLNTTSVCLR